MVPPPRSERIAAEELPEVVIFKFEALIVPPPVTMIPPELFEVVLIAVSEMSIVELP